MFKIKTGYKLQISTNETMVLLGNGPIVDQDENGVNVPELEQVHSVLLHCCYLQNSKLLYTFVRNNAFGQLLSIQSEALTQSKTTILFLITLKFGSLIKAIILYNLKIV